MKLTCRGVACGQRRCLPASIIAIVHSFRQKEKENELIILSDVTSPYSTWNFAFCLILIFYSAQFAITFSFSEQRTSCMGMYCTVPPVR